MRILAVEDGAFELGEPSKSAGARGSALLIGVVISNFNVERLITSQIEVDGLDATHRLIEVAKKERKPLNLIMLGSIFYGGFNIIDIVQAYEELNIPIIVSNPKKPKEGAVETALLHHFPDWKDRLEIIRRTKKPKKFILEKGKSIYFQTVGITTAQAKKIIKGSIIFGKRPEPLRIARMLAHELSR